MKTKPKILQLLPWIFVAIALSFPIQVMLLYGHTPLEAHAIWSKISAFNWVVILACLAMSVLIGQVSSAAIMALLPLNVLVIWNNHIVGKFGSDFTPTEAHVGSVAFLGLSLLILTPAAREAFLDPQMRWWQTPKRFQIRTPVLVLPRHGTAFKADTFDFSRGGLFVTSREDGTTTSLKPGDLLSLRLNLGALAVLRCDARVVRTTTGSGRYPMGLGIEFRNLSRQSRVEIDRFLRLVQ